MVLPFNGNDDGTQFDRNTTSRFRNFLDLQPAERRFHDNLPWLDAARAAPSNYVKITVST